MGNITKQFMSGNEAIARGAFDAGCKVGVGYPGTPSTEILENFVKYDGVYAEWSVNEKVAAEVGIGAALSGSRTIVTMKHVGLNVAADPVFTLSYMGVKAGLVIVTADDPNLYSSQNEQDNRNYARASKIPMLEPSSSQEAYDFVKMAFELSETFDTPVFLRPTTRISHSKSVVTLDESAKTQSKVSMGFDPNPQKFVMVPGFARKRHFAVEDRMAKLAEFAETSPLNVVEMNDKKIGIITSGISYAYAKESCPNASFLKIGMCHPLPKKKIIDFVNSVEQCYVIEELDPFMEMEIKSYGCKVIGKELFPITGEFSPDLIREKIYGKNDNGAVKPIADNIPARMPALCPGCPHRTVYSLIRKYNTIVTGDIGCYTLGVMPPFRAIDTCVDMGASITVAQGMSLSIPDKKMIAVIGDSTFAHSGITGLVNAAFNKKKILVIVMDNWTTAMTGMQVNPFVGETLNGRQTIQVNYKKLAEAVGIDDDNYQMVDAYKKDEVEAAIDRLMAKDSLSLLVVKAPCVIYKRKKKL
ncbi:MAG: indolepyruvate ferredoxin oxidoreductase subunit alpha [Spirochaetales bacterium]|nr:indolepyruvate ferredoxin oxidoreductase subunit alpha [Spirochaetales bacterium]